MILIKAQSGEVITTIILVFLHNMHSCYLPTGHTVETGIDNYKYKEALKKIYRLSLINCTNK